MQHGTYPPLEICPRSLEARSLRRGVGNLRAADVPMPAGAITQDGTEILDRGSNVEGTEAERYFRDDCGGSPVRSRFHIDAPLTVPCIQQILNRRDE